jgi:hypothetical protein
MKILVKNKKKSCWLEVKSFVSHIYFILLIIIDFPLISLNIVNSRPMDVGIFLGTPWRKRQIFWWKQKNHWKIFMTRSAKDSSSVLNVSGVKLSLEQAAKNWIYKWCTYILCKLRYTGLKSVDNQSVDLGTWILEMNFASTTAHHLESKRNFLSYSTN